MVKRMYRFLLFVALSLSAAVSGSGQVRGGGMPVRGISRPGRAVASRPRSQSPSRVGTPLHPNFAPIRGVPGLGFDFQHLAAISRPIRDRFGREHRQILPFIAPVFGTLPLYDSFDPETPDYYDEAEQQPQFIMSPQQPQAAAPPPREAAPIAPPAVAQFPAPPPPELGQLILVRRDGQVLLAVAFTTVRGQLTYITREGTRRSFPVSELDKTATREMNDANGTSVSLPD
jgi:hypothetical protein